MATIVKYGKDLVELLKMLVLKKYDCQTQIKTVCAKNLLGYV
jgi:hypothetical protein